MENIYKPVNHLVVGKSIYKNESKDGIVLDLTSSRIIILNRLNKIYEFMVFEKNEYNPEKELKPLFYMQLNDKSVKNIKKYINLF